MAKRWLKRQGRIKMFEKLFEPVMIGSMEVKNRIVMCPMGLGYASVTGAVTDRLIDYYTERAKGGVGLIIVEGTCIEGYCSALKGGIDNQIP
jgi:2,4-dienoyl-CoA reductase-like NADH-dependent reductase (Old Yellow Enzyme family)